MLRTLMLMAASRRAAGSVAQADMKLSMVDGAAFADFGAANILPNHLGQKISIFDSAGKEAVGWIKAAGTGETLDSDLLSGWDFTSGWVSTGTGAIIDTDTYETTVAGGVYKSVLTNKKLFKFTGNWGSTASNLSFNQVDGDLGGGYRHIIANGASGDVTKYFCGGEFANAIYLYIRNNDVGVTNITSMDLKQVLTPSTTGATIVSASGGSTYNWLDIESGFDYNDASGYTYIIQP